MTAKIEDAAHLLADARTSHRRIRLPQRLLPVDVSEAYAIQEQVSHQLGAPIRGWKVGAPDSATEPTAAPIYEVLPSGSKVSARRLNMIGVEAELAFVIGQAFAPRDTPYTAAETLAAVTELRVAIEICDSRLDDWQSATELTKLADHQLNFALVLGDAAKSGRDVDYRSLDVLTYVNEVLLKAGRGCHALGDPTVLLPWLVNHAARRGGIAAGTAVTTGSWLGMHFVQPGAKFRVEFPALGRAEVEFSS